MKSYSFAKVSARGYLTEADYNNKYKLNEDLRLIINVSERDFERPQEFFQERNITARFMPLTEKNGDMGYSWLLDAVKLLLDNDRNGHRSIVCCAFGVNRSRTWKSPVCVTPEAQVPLTLESKFRMTPIKS